MEMAVIKDKNTADARDAVTHYEVIGDYRRFAHLECRLETGRTHQIRIHAQHLGCPLLGDPQYGGPEGHPLHLHSRAISLPLYPKREPVGAVAPIPAHMRAALAACGFAGDPIHG